jgi:methyltransferase family protein
MPITRYQYMARVHEIVKPEVYLEIGVQSGASLVLAEGAGMAIGVDPEPGAFNAGNQRDNQRRFSQTADEYFACVSCERPAINFGFVDGLHLVENALRDYLNIELHAAKGAVVLVDDVLPYNQDVAWRHQPPGDWTGDVFKLMSILGEYQPGLTQRLVDVTPTGALMVTGLDPRNVALEKQYDQIVADWTPRHHVPDVVLGRVGALSADAALAQLADEMESLKKRGIRA